MGTKTEKLNNLGNGESPEHEITFSAANLKKKLTDYKTNPQLQALAFRRTQKTEIQQRQKFLLTEKPRVSSQGCSIDLGVYANSPDGVDGKWGTNTETSTVNYLNRLFDTAHPERRVYVNSKLTARAQLETNERERPQQGAATKEAKMRVAQVISKKEKLNELLTTRNQLGARNLVGQKGKLPGIDEQILPGIDEQIHQLETSIAEVEQVRNISLEEQRTTNLFFVMTLDGNKVIYNEHAEALHTAATEAIESICSMHATDNKGKIISIPAVLEELVEKKKAKIRSSSEYQQTITHLQTQGISAEQAQKIVDEQSDKAATTLVLREFTYNISHENTYGLSAETIGQIQNDEHVMLFTELFEKVIIDWYEDITDQNHLDRALPLPLDPYFETVTKVTIYENPTIEKYLFDIPSKQPKELYSSDYRSQKTQDYLGSQILGGGKETKDTGSTTNKGEKEDTSQTNEKNTHLEEFTSELNTFASKRMRQLLLYQHFRTLKNIFQQVDSEGVSLQSTCDFDLSKMDVNNTHTMRLPFTYGHVTTQLEIEGATGNIHIPTLLDNYLGLTSFPQLAKTSSQTSLEEQLTQAATLSNAEILQCTSRQDIETLITAKMSNKLLELSPPTPDAEQVATDIEHEELLANIRGYIDNTHESKNASDNSKKPEIQSPEFSTFIQSLVQPTERQALSLLETKKINEQLESMHTLFSSLTKQPGGFEDFFSDSGLLNIPPAQRPTKVVAFFNACEMATSTEDAIQKKGLEDVQQLTQEITPLLIGVAGSGARYIYADKKIQKNS